MAQTVSEYFKEPLTIEKLTMNQYEELDSGEEWVTNNVDGHDDDFRDGLAKDMDVHSDDEREALARLLLISGTVVKEFADQPYLGPYTHVRIMEIAMQRLKKQCGWNAPAPWVPVIKRLRTFAEIHANAMPDKPAAPWEK